MSSPPLRSPIRELLDDSLNARELRDLWLRVDTGSQRRRLSVLSPAAAALTLAAALVLVFHFRSPAHEALRLDDSAEIPASVSATSTRALVLNDGSEVSVAAGSRLDLLLNDRTTFWLALRIGSAEFDVKPGGSRTWRLECGTVTIDVVGTHFTVARTSEHVAVRVTRGAVLVRGDAVPDRVVRVGAGQDLTVPTRN